MLKSATYAFKRNLRRWPKSAVYGHQGPASGDVQRGGEFEEVLAVLIAAPDKNRDGKRQSNPLAAFYDRLALIHTKAPHREVRQRLVASMGPNPFIMLRLTRLKRFRGQIHNQMADIS